MKINCNYFVVKSTDFDVSVKKFDLSKEYKLVIYYRSLNLLFSKEFFLKVSVFLSFLLIHTDFIQFGLHGFSDHHTSNKVSQPNIETKQNRMAITVHFHYN